MLANVLKFVIVLAAKAELGALFMNYKKGEVIQKFLKEMTPPTTHSCSLQQHTAVIIAKSPESTSAPNQWRYIISGLPTNNNERSSIYVIILATKIWPTTNQNTISAPTILQLNHGTFTPITHLLCYQGCLHPNSYKIVLKM